MENIPFCSRRCLPSSQVVCFPQFCSEDNPPKHPPVTAGRYLLGKYSQTHQDFDGNQREHKDS